MDIHVHSTTFGTLVCLHIHKYYKSTACRQVEEKMVPNGIALQQHQDKNDASHSLTHMHKHTHARMHAHTHTIQCIIRQTAIQLQRFYTTLEL